MSVTRYLYGQPLQNMGTTVAWPIDYICDTYAERPVSGLIVGSRCFAKDNGNWYVATSATAWAQIGGGAGGAAWGGITGTLSNQTDLQNALNAKGTSNFSGAYADLTGKPVLFSGAYSALTGIPSTFTPAAHTHAAGDITSGPMAAARLGSGTPDSTTFLRGDGTWATPAGGSDPWTYLRLANDFPTTSGTAVDVTGLAFTPAANQRYEFEAQLMLRTSTAAANPRVGLAWPSGMTDGVASIEEAQSATAAISARGNIAAALLVAVGGLPNATQSWPCSVWGMALSGASPSGSIRIQLATETATTTTATVKAGSFLKWRLIP
jgi:hypothetical protein